MTHHPSPAKRPTLEDVAALAGVSRATVSRVANGSTKVDPKLAAVVQKAMTKLNYVPNIAARALMTGRTNTIALVAAEPDARVFGDPFFSNIVRGVSLEMAAAGQHLILSMIQRHEDSASVERYLLGEHVDGVLLISEHWDVPLAKTLTSAGIPFVIGGRPMHPDVGTPYVDNDNLGGAAAAARHLLDLGRTRIATITGPLDMSAGVDRLGGFRDCLGDHFEPELVEHADFTINGGALATGRLLQRVPDVDAVFAASDLMAFGAIAALRRSGRRVPEDVSVVGFDDINLAVAFDPPLTTVRQHTQLQGRMMVRLLLSLLGRDLPESADDLPEIEPGHDLVLPVELIVRGSA